MCQNNEAHYSMCVNFTVSETRLAMPEWNELYIELIREWVSYFIYFLSGFMGIITD